VFLERGVSFSVKCAWAYLTYFGIFFLPFKDFVVVEEESFIFLGKMKVELEKAECLSIDILGSMRHFEIKNLKVCSSSHCHHKDFFLVIWI